MANVLPPDERKRVIREMHARFVTAFALVLTLAAVLMMAGLLPALISVRLAIADVPEEVELSATSREDQNKQVRALAITNALTPIMTATTTPSAITIAVLQARPVGIQVTSISYAKGKIVVNGSSRDRQAVNAYREALAVDPRFSAVSVPVAALVGAQDGRFTITLSGAF